MMKIQRVSGHEEAKCRNCRISLSVVLFVLVVVAINDTDQASAVTYQDNQSTTAAITKTAPKASVVASEVDGDAQSVTINTGYEPKVVVVQKGMLTRFEFNLQGQGCDQFVVFAQQEKEIDLSDNHVVTITPTEDFEVSCGMGMDGFKVKVVDDVNSVDVEQIQADIANNPDLYETSSSGCSCPK